MLKISLTFGDSNVTDCTNKRCFPRPKTIRSHIIRTIRKLRHSKIYQGCFIKKIVKWEKDLLTPQFILEQKVSKATVWWIHMTFSQRPNLLIYLPSWKLVLWYRNSKFEFIVIIWYIALFVILKRVYAKYPWYIALSSANFWWTKNFSIFSDGYGLIDKVIYSLTVTGTMVLKGRVNLSNTSIYRNIYFSSSLTGMLTILIEDSLVDKLERYIACLVIDLIIQNGENDMQ